MMDYKKIVEHYRTCHLTILKWSRGEGGVESQLKNDPHQLDAGGGLSKLSGV